MLLRAASSGGFDVPRCVQVRNLSPIVTVVLLVVCIGAVAGCGVTGGANGGGNAPGTATPNTKAVAKGCVDGAGGTVDVGAPALVLTLQDARHESTVHVGDVLQVRLPATQRWSMARGGTGTLATLQPAGYWDVKASACVWNFKAARAGATTLGFVGTALCEPGRPCPAYAIAEDFPVTVV